MPKKGKKTVAAEGITPEEISGLVVELAESLFHSHQHSRGGHKIQGLELSPDFHGLPNLERISMVERGRAMALTNPVCKQVRALWTNYGVGTGFDWRPRSSKANKIIEAVVENPDNRCIFSSFGQRKTSDIKLTDGELFFAVFGKGATAKIRRVDTLQITDIAYDPNDVDSPRYYIRTVGAGDNKRQTIFADWRNEDLQDGMLADGTMVRVVKVEGGDNKIEFRDTKDVEKPNKDPVATFAENAVMHQDIFDGTGRRGHSLFLSSLPWMHAQNHFMRDRVSIMAALAQFAWKIKAKGGSAAVNAIVSQLESTLTVAGGADNNPRHAAGSTFAANENVDMDAVQQETGAAAARVDGDMLMNMSGVGSGVFAQYLGRGDLPNYAMANSMEGPMLKQWEAYQRQLEDMYSTLFFIVLRSSVQAKDRIVDIDTPELIRRDTPAMIDAVTKLFAVMPDLVSSDEMKLQVLTLFAIDNPSTVLDQIKAAPPIVPEITQPAPVTQPAPTDGGQDAKGI